jgi:hypothetical protein
MSADAAERWSLQGRCMTVSTAVRSPHRLRRGTLAALATATAVAGGIIVLGSSGGGDGAQSQSGSPSLAEVLAPLTPEQRLYVERISLAGPEQLAAWFGTDGVQKPRTPLKPGANVR